LQPKAGKQVEKARRRRVNAPAANISCARCARCARDFSS
jgi:hypothetical protein